MSDANRTPSSFLGSGWSFPPDFGAGNDVVMTDGQADIEGSLRILFGTAAGERFLVPGYGLDMHDLQFESISTGLRNALRDRIKLAILMFEPRITLISLAVESPEYPHDGVLYIALEYAIRATNSRHNLVYPFYVGDAIETPPPTPRR